MKFKFDETMRKKILTASLAGLLLTGMPMTAQAETLETAVSSALSSHPSIMAARARHGAAKESITEEKSAYYPTANATASFGRVFSDNTTTRGLSTQRGTGYSWYGDGRVALNQTLYDWSATGHRVMSAKERYKSSGFLFEDRQSAIEFQTTQSYVQLVRAEALKAQAITHLSAMNTYKNRVQTAVNNGGADRSELSRAQDLVSLADNARAQVDADFDIAQAGFMEAVGRLPEGDLFDPTFDLGTLPDVLDDAIHAALNSHPQINAAKRDANSAFYEKKAEDANLYPTFDAELSYSEKDQKDLIGGESKDARALVKMNWDMSLGGGEKAARRRLRYQHREADLIVEDLSRTVERDVKVAWTSFYLASKQKSNEAERLSAAKKTLSTYKEQYEGGQKKILDLMTAKAQVFAANQAYTNLLYREMDAAYALRSLVGVKDMPSDMSDQEG